MLGITGTAEKSTANGAAPSVVDSALSSADVRRLKRTTNDVVHETTGAREWPGYPREAIAIANNGSGDYLVFLPSDDEAARAAAAVHRWDHETGELACVAAAFDELRWSPG